MSEHPIMRTADQPAGPGGLPDCGDPFIEGLRQIGRMRPETPLRILDLCLILGGCSDDKVYRMLRNGELPHPRKLCGKNVWTAGGITAHVTDYIDQAQREYTEALKR